MSIVFDERAKALAFLRKHPMGILSTVSSDNTPWGSAIYYVAEDDFACYFVTRSESQKFKNIDQNPAVALTVADEPTQTTVQIAGRLQKVPAREVIDVVFKKLAHIKPPHDIDWLPPVIKVHEGDWMVLELTPTHVQYADYRQNKKEVSDSYITKIL